MTELLELPELELSDDQLQDISGGCQNATLSLGGLHLGFGHSFHYGGGFGFGGFFGGPVLVAQPVQQVQYQVVEATPVTAVQATSCQQQVALALV